MDTQPWSTNLAYAVGLLATDGNLSKDGRHIDLTSKDKEQLINFMVCIGKVIPITYKTSGFTKKKISRLQFSDVMLYRFLLHIGLMPGKTKIISSLKIPKKYFFDFLRGHFDGDGYSYSYLDERWNNSFMLYVNFVSASKLHIHWLQGIINRRLKIRGQITLNKSVFLLRYAKTASLQIIRQMYYSPDVVCLKRKRLKIQKALAILGHIL